MGEPNRLSDEAIDWVVRLHSGRATTDDHDAFSVWRAQSHDHELAAQEAETLWHGVGAAGSRARKKTSRRGVVIGGLALAAGAAMAHGPIRLRLTADHITAPGERREIALPDGSSVLLNGASALALAYGGGERRLRLLRGQAGFSVAHDPARPFIVEANGGETRALGTVFDVDIAGDMVGVTVLEGIVAVTSGTASAVTVAANQRVRYAATGAPSGVEAVDADTETAWRRGKLIFNGRRLEDVVAEIGHYRSGTIVIADPDLASLQVTGVFDLSDPEAVLDTIEQTLPVRVTRLPFVTVLR